MQANAIKKPYRWGFLGVRDFQWDHGFITNEVDFMEKRLQLQQELEQFTPIPEDDLERVADLLANFGEHWKACGEDKEAQRRLIMLIVKRVYVLDEEIVAVTLQSGYHVVLGHKLNGPTEVSVDPYLYTSGSDGRRILIGSLAYPPQDSYLCSRRHACRMVLEQNMHVYVVGCFLWLGDIIHDFYRKAA